MEVEKCTLSTVDCRLDDSSILTVSRKDILSMAHARLQIDCSLHLVHQKTEIEVEENDFVSFFSAEDPVVTTLTNDL